MYVEAICPLCFAKHIVPAERRGAKYRCEACEEVFIVNWKSKTTYQKPRRLRQVRSAEDPEAEVLPVDLPEVLPVAARGPRRRPEASGRTKRRPRGTGWLIAGSAGGALVVALAALGIWWAVASRDRATAEATSTRADDSGRTVLPVARGRQPATDQPPEKPDPLRPDPPRPEPPLWKVHGDPPAAAFQLPANFRKELPVRAAGPGVLFPTATSSLVVAVGDNFLADDERQVWDLRANALTGKLSSQKFSASPPVLSPDGAHVALVPFGKQSLVTVWTLKTQTSVSIEPGFTPGLIDFAGPGKLLLAELRGTALRVQLWDAATGRRERECEGPSLGDVPALTRDMLAVSPGGRYLAVVAPGDLWIWDLKLGSAAGRRAVPWNTRELLFPCRGLSFSRDGRELAALIETQGQGRLVCWDVTGGEVAFELTFPSLKLGADKPLAYAGQVLGWIGQRQGWLLYGHAQIDRRTSKVHVPPGLDGPSLPFRRMLGPEHIATLTGQGDNKLLRIARFQPDHLAD